MRETKQQKSARARAIIERLAATHPEARTALRFSSPLELLVAVILSAQSTDVRVNLVTPALFARFRTPEDYAQASTDELEGYVRTLGLFRSKARALVAAGKAIVEQHGGQVPTRRAELAELPGVGNKTAGVVAMHLSDERALPVDTHVARLAYRLGLSAAQKPDLIERDLRALLPPELWATAHHALIWHGRRICVARGPRCAICPVNPLCPKRGVASPRRR